MDLKEALRVRSAELITPIFLRLRTTSHNLATEDVQELLNEEASRLDAEWFRLVKPS